MNPNARHVIERKPRTKLQAFAEECPEVPAAMGDLIRLCDLYAGGFTLPEQRALFAARNLLARMAGEEPPR